MMQQILVILYTFCTLDLQVILHIRCWPLPFVVALLLQPSFRKACERYLSCWNDSSNNHLIPSRCATRDGIVDESLADSAPTHVYPGYSWCFLVVGNASGSMWSPKRIRVKGATSSSFRGRGNFHKISYDDVIVLQLFRKRSQIKFSSQHFRKWKLFSFNQNVDRTIRTN